MSLRKKANQVLADAISSVYEGKMTTTSGGNFSVRDEGDYRAFWITPAGKDKGKLEAEDMVHLIEGEVVEGRARPSSEFPIHRAIYEKRNDVRAVIHAHPPALVAFALARKSPDLSVLPQVELLCGPVGYADYELPGSEKLGEVIAMEFEKGANIVMMENHGVVVGGVSMEEALLRLKSAEFCSQVIIDSAVLGGAQGVENIKGGRGGEVVFSWADSQVKRRADIQRVQEELTALSHRASKQGLVSPYGYGRGCGISKRLEAGGFVITSPERELGMLMREDMLYVREGEIWSLGEKNPLEKGVRRRDDLFYGLHEVIYKCHPEINSVMITHSPAVMAHAVARVALEVSSNPESWVFVREVALQSYASLEKAVLSEASDYSVSSVVEILSRECPAVLIENWGLIVTGGELMQTFDRLEVCEFTAKSLLKARALGGAVPLELEKIKELKEAFC